MGFRECFLAWVQAISDLTQGQVIAVDGKTLRRSHDRTLGKSAIHLVSAWATANRLVLGQVKVDEESTEKLGIKAKRLKAGWDEEYLLKILSI